jgi:uncharacterized protein YdeI (YjbR/CyaY-like superfamily)
MNNTSVDSYLEDGCGRCDLYKTTRCKVRSWTEALNGLREVLSETGLTEEMKWGSPCYTLNGKNVVMIAAFKDSCALSFFKGALLEDEHGVLEAPGPNSRFARLYKFASAEEVQAGREVAAGLIQRAIEAERSGRKVAPGPVAEPIPDELRARLDADSVLAEAFEGLTPGRRRSHILYVSGPKQSKTRETRAERCVAKILAGKGYNER